MKFKRILIVTIILLAILTVGAVSASEDVTADDNVTEILSADEASQDILQEDVLGASPGTFTDLANDIAKAGNTLNLNRNYAYTDSDSYYKNGITIDKTITVNGNGYTIDGNSKARTFKITASNVVLKNINFKNSYSADDGGAVYWEGFYGTLSNCYFMNSKSGDEGGAVYCSGYSCKLANCRFVDCSADLGGAVNWAYSYGTLSGCSFISCSAYRGGAVYSSGYHVDLYNSSFAVCDASNDGGAVYFWKGVQFNLYDCSFNYCEAEYGGAVFAYSAESVVTNCNFANSNSRNWGGAVFWFDMDNGVLSDCTFVNSSAEQGGAICWRGDDGKVSDCTFVNSTARYSYGGAVYWDGNNGTLSDCSFENSHSDYITGSGGAVGWGGDYGNIHDCSFVNSHTKYNGGAIIIRGDNCVLSDCSFSDCSSNNGGAVDWAFAYGTLSDCSFSDCSAKSGGAVLWSGKNGILSDSSFINCFTFDGEETTYFLVNAGGAVYWKGNDGTIDESSFINCHADKYGGGIYFGATGCSLINPIFESNSAPNGPDWYSPNDVDVIKTVKSTVLSASNVDTTYNSGKKLVATLKDNKGKAIVGAKVKIQLGSVAKTMITDTQGQVSLTTDGLVPDTYTATIAFDGTDVYKKSSTTAKVTVNKAATKLTAKYDANSQNIVANVKDANGNPVKGLKVGFAIDGVKYVTTDANGQAKYSTAGLGDDTYTVTVQAYGNDLYADSNKQTVTVSSTKTPTTLTASDVTTAYDGGKKLVATLKDNSGKAVKDAQIKIALGDSTKTLTTDANGQVSLTTDGLVPNTYIATITFAGNGAYKASSTTAKVTVNKLETKLTAKYDANSKNIVATVKDANGNPVKGLKVGFAIGGVKYVTTDANGQAKYSTAGLADGTYKVTVQASGNEIYKDSDKQTVSFTIGSKQQAKIYLRNALYFVLQTKMVTVTLWDANKNPIAGKTVYINLDEYGLKYSGVTDENGDAQIRVGVGFGNHPATVSFEGDDTYGADSKTGRVRVIKETPSLMLPGKYTKFKATDATKTIKVYLKDRYNKPLLPGTKVFVKINGQQYVGSIDNEGIATININLKNKGSYDVELYYTGNTAYNAVRKTTKITIV